MTKSLFHEQQENIKGNFIVALLLCTEEIKQIW